MSLLQRIGASQKNAEATPFAQQQRGDCASDHSFVPSTPCFLRCHQYNRFLRRINGAPRSSSFVAVFFAIPDPSKPACRSLFLLLLPRTRGRRGGANYNDFELRISALRFVVLGVRQSPGPRYYRRIHATLQAAASLRSGPSPDSRGEHPPPRRGESAPIVLGGCEYSSPCGNAPSLLWHQSHRRDWRTPLPVPLTKPLQVAPQFSPGCGLCRRCCWRGRWSW